MIMNMIIVMIIIKLIINIIVIIVMITKQVIAGLPGSRTRRSGPWLAPRSRGA